METITKADFMKGWKGNVTAESSLLNPVITASAQKPVPTARLLNQDETQNIRGAFFFFFVPAIIGALTQIGGAVWAVLNGIGTIIAAVGQMVGNALISIQGALQSLGQGLSYLGEAIFKGMSFAASSLSHAFGNVGSFLSQNIFGSIAKAGFGNTLFQTAVKVGFSVATQKGLEALGVNPTISGFASAFVTGGITGGFNAGFTAANFIQGGVKALALQGTQTVLQNAGMDAPLLDTLNLIVEPFVDGVLIGDIGGVAVQIVKDLPKYASFYGIQKIAEFAGIDSRIAGIAGLPIATALNQGLKDGNLLGQGMINVLNQAVKGTFAAYSTQLIVDQLPSNLGGSLLSSVLSSTFNKVINSTSPTNVVDALLESLGDLGQKIASTENIIKLSQAISALGLKEGLEKHLQDVFERSTIESIVQSAGSVGNLVQLRIENVVDTIFKGIQAKKLDLSTTNSNAAIYYEQKADGLKFLGYEENGGFANLDTSGPNLLSADISKYYGGGTTLTQIAENNKTTRWEVRDKQTNELFLEIADAASEIIPGTPVVITRIKNFLLDGVLEISDGGVINVQLDASDSLDATSTFSSISGDAGNNIVKQWLLSVPGVGPETGNQIPAYLQNHTALLQQKFTDAGLSQYATKNISFFKGSRPQDIKDLIANEFTGKLNGEMRSAIDQFYANNNIPKGTAIAPMFYSGSVEPGLKALEMGQDNVPIVFAVGGYNSHTIGINNSSIQMFVNIQGDNDGIASNKTYSGIETLNVVFINGVAHTDYFTKPIYNEFIATARLKAAEGVTQLRNFIVNSQYKVKMEGNVVYLDLENS